MRRNQKGFTLIDRKSVVAGKGVHLGGGLIIIKKDMQRSKQKRTMADMRTIATAWEARATDVNRYNAAGVTLPTVSVSAATLGNYLSPTYVKTFPQRDGWGNNWNFWLDQGMATATAAQVYAIVSGGKDGTFQGNNPIGGEIGTFHCCTPVPNNTCIPSSAC